MTIDDKVATLSPERRRLFERMRATARRPAARDRVVPDARRQRRHDPRPDEPERRSAVLLRAARAHPAGRPCGRGSAERRRRPGHPGGRAGRHGGRTHSRCARGRRRSRASGLRRLVVRRRPGLRGGSTARGSGRTATARRARRRPVRGDAWACAAGRGRAATPVRSPTSPGPRGCRRTSSRGTCRPRRSSGAYALFAGAAEAQYRYHPPARYAGPVVVLQAQQNQARVAEWRDKATGPFRHQLLAGGHYDVFGERNLPDRDRGAADGSDVRG